MLCAARDCGNKFVLPLFTITSFLTGHWKKKSCGLGVMSGSWFKQWPFFHYDEAKEYYIVTFV